ncbi:hypothetical protein [Thalassolituus hydrocarboniclasticus]|uniref:DUF4347 domain-containing protein n=1 Tax=Thalassolituus hydrocarboniclasticus TaxID=2742796 RepID=A0ABY6ADQ4_9GAMM|nr:hypothetical protein [Thalassolituus hydrocarboniclasticus]UXD89194.1 hypothetical protein HUF19_17915 [Thalassolituus hydrocarboniclasticus]
MSSNIPLRILLSGLLGAGLAACSNDSSNSSSGSSTTMSGKVADGYLAGARVCLDLNANQVCDDGEPSTTSSSGGSFTITNATAEQIASAAIVVEIIVGETIDEDNPGTAINKTYTLTAPAGYGFVSPLTTMVQNEVREKGVTPDEAKASIQTRLGTSVDLEEDYVAGSDGGGNDAAEFERVHKVAQVTRAVMQQNIETVTQVLDGANVSFEDVLALIVSQVLEALETIGTAVDNSSGEFDADALVDSGVVDDAGIDPSVVEDDLAEREAERNASSVSIAGVLSGGGSLHFFESDEDNGQVSFYYGTVSSGGGSSVTVTDYRYNSSNGLWETQASESNSEQTCILSSGSWTCVSEDAETIAISGDSVVVSRGGLSVAQETISGIAVSLTDKRIQTYANDEYFSLALDPTAKFSTNATGYKLTFTRSNDYYELYKDNTASIADCWDGTANTEGPWAPTDTWCNNAFTRTGDGNAQTDGNAAAALSELISANAAVSPETPEDIKGTDLYGNDKSWLMEFVSGGTLNFYPFSYGEGGPTLGSKVSGSWVQKTVDGKTILQFTLPELVAAQGDFDRYDRVQFFTVHEGYVRRGYVAKAGSSSDDEWVFNDTARDDIKAAFDDDLLVSLVACTAGDADAALIGALDTAATGCSATAFISDDVAGKSLTSDFGIFTFAANNTGSYFGELGDDGQKYLDFTWSIDGSGYIVINTSTPNGDGTTLYLRMNIAKVEQNARQVSVVTLGLEADSEAGLDSASGDVRGEVWNIR